MCNDKYVNFNYLIPLSTSILNFVINDRGICKIASVFPNSVADIVGLSINDEILAVNGNQINREDVMGSFNGWCNYFANKSAEGVMPIVLTIAAKGKVKSVALTPQIKSFYNIVSIKKLSNASSEQRKNFENWSKHKFK